MLAQNFKSADDLGITEPRKEALMKTLVLLETGKLVHTATPERYEYFAENFTGHFNMAGWRRKASCGSICCIGGTAEIIGNTSFCLNEIPCALQTLFFPNMHNDGPHFQYKNITVNHAATALRSYLTTGDAKWHEAVA